MKFSYKINKHNYEVIFCPDKEGLKTKNKKILHANHKRFKEDKARW